MVSMYRKNPNQNFIQVNSTKSGTITIDYSWVAAPIEAQAQYLQIGLLIVAIPMLIILYRKKKYIILP